MIDTHAHIYLSEFDADRASILSDAQSVGIENILMPNIDVNSIEAMLSVEASHEGYCHAMMGLHPTSVKEDYRDQLQMVEQWLTRRKFIAIGEIGIDLYWDQSNLEQQKEVFQIQLEWAKAKGLPVAIHVRDAFDQVFDIMDKVADMNLKGVFHSFSGDRHQALKALSYPGFFLGINGIVTFKNAGLDKVLADTGYERLVTETDAPYLAPVPHRGKRNQPAYMTRVLHKLADIFEVPFETIEKITTRNANDLFNTMPA